MDKTEVVALVIVVIAVVCVLWYFIKQKKNGGCSKDCFKPKDSFKK